MTGEPPEEWQPCETAVPPEPPYPFWTWSDLALFAGLVFPCLLLGWALVRLAFAAFHYHPALKVLELLPEQLIGYALIFGALAAIFRLQYERPFWSSLGWCPLQLPAIWIMTSGALTSLGVALVGSLIHTPVTENPIMELLENRTSAILMAIFGIAIAPPCEELAFRGFLQPLLVRSLGVFPGIALTAIPFGLLHYREFGNSWRHALLIAMAGATFGWMRHVTNSTKASALMHSSYNALIFVAVFTR